MPQAFWTELVKQAVIVAVDVAVQVAINYAKNKLLNKDAKRPPGWSPIKQPVPPRHYCYGRGRKRGAALLYESVDGKIVDVLAYCQGRIGGNWEHWLHDDKVTVDGAGNVQPLNGHYFGNKINISTREGLPVETAHTNITSVAGAVWTADHRADGVATVGMRCAMIAAEKMADLFPNGEPEHSASADWRLCYDWRKDSTSGGVGGHRRDDPATWEHSNNVVVQWVNDKCFVEGRDWGRYFSRVVADLTDEANAADEPVPLAAGGTVARYESFVWYEADMSTRAVTEMFVGACDGWTIELGDGSMIFRVGRWIEPVDVITADMVIDLTWTGGVPKSRLYNEVQPRFSNPALDYEIADTTPFRDQASIDARGRRPMVLEVPEVTNNSQIMRLAKIRLLQLMSPYSGQWVLDLDLVPASATRQRFHRVQITGYQTSLQDVYVEFMKPEIDLVARTLTVDVRLVDPSWYSWTVEEEGDGQVVVVRPNPGVAEAPSIFDVAAFAVTPETQRMRIFISDAQLEQSYMARWRVTGSTDWTQETPQTTIAGTPWPFIETGTISAGAIEVQVAYIAPNGSSTDWSETNTTAPRRVTSGGDVRTTGGGDVRTVE